jgi:hypothetical protein
MGGDRFLPAEALNRNRTLAVERDDGINPSLIEILVKVRTQACTLERAKASGLSAS